MKKREFLMGNEVLARSAFQAGAEIMFGYPITPVTEVFSTWVKLAEQHHRQYLQTEDEYAAGFGVCGAVLAGDRAFTATSGPGMILMQDPLSMAEALRLPVVVFDGQRGGPSTGQVIYSQQEVNLAIYGGNGEGFRIVYSTSSLQDLFYYGQKVFEVAWKYRFPTVLLYDGYQGKMKGPVEVAEIGNHPPAGEAGELGIRDKQPILTTNLKNTYNLEEELAAVTLQTKDDFEKAAPEVAEYEIVNNNAEVVIFTHGIVAAAAKVALEKLQKRGIPVGLFRPITLSPFPIEKAREALREAHQIVIFESSLGQFSRLLKDKVFWKNEPLIEVQKPGIGFTPEEIEQKILGVLT